MIVVVMSVNWCPTAGLLVPISTALHHPTGDRKPGKAFTSLTVLVGEWEGQLPSRIRPGKIGRSQISALDITRGRPVKWYIAVPMSVGLVVTSHMEPGS